MSAGDDLAVAVQRLHRHVSHWTPARWRVCNAAGAPRAAVVYELVQRIADLGADVEGLPRRTVPHLEQDSALGDQLRVVADDLATAGAPDDVLGRAAALVTQAHQAL